jgi:hypothetical protein
MAYTAQVSADNRAKADQVEQELRTQSDTWLRCIDTGLKSAEYAAKLREEFVKAGNEPNPQRQVALMNVVIAAFPPMTAQRILQAAASEGGSPAVQDRYARAREQLEEEGAHEEKAACPTVNLVLESVSQQQTAPADLRAETAPLALNATGCAPNPPPAPLGAAVFPQIVQPADEQRAREILAGLVQLAPGTVVNAIDTVPSRNPQKAKAEVRYYYQDQKETAERLGALLDQVECLQGKGKSGKFAARYIGDQFSNLPRGRVELWFPALNKPG